MRGELILYDFNSLAGCLDRCSCGGQPGVIHIRDVVSKQVIECPDCKARSNEGSLWEIMVSWNKERRKENGRI